MGNLPAVNPMWVPYSKINVVHDINTLENTHTHIHTHTHTHTHVFLSVDAQKTFNKIQHIFMIKALSKLSVEMNFNLIKSIHNKAK